MDERATPGEVTTISSRGDELSPDTTSYLIVSEETVLIVDPGPEWHIRSHQEQIRSLISPDSRIIAVVQSPMPGCLSGLTRLATLARRRHVVLHWQIASAAGTSLAGWKVTTVTKRVALRFGAGHRYLVTAAYEGPPGSIIGYESGRRALYSGPFFGSIGSGRSTDIPVLRREAVRAYSDLFTPTVTESTVSTAFGRSLDVARVCPAHGRPAVGGHELIARLFAGTTGRFSLAQAFYALYRRAAALAGEAVAGGMFSALNVPLPQLDRGYGETGYQFELSEQEASIRWRSLYEKLSQWLPEIAVAALHLIVARLSLQSGLPVPDELEHVAGSLRSWWSREHTAGEPAQQERNATAARSRTENFDDLTDELTGLLNEEVFRQRLRGQVTQGDSRTGNGAVLFVGIDNLRQINAGYGRAGGDEALYTCAYLLRNFQAAHSRRGAQRLYKLTGPTFAYVLTGGDVAEAAEIAEEIRASVAESSMFLQRLTVSIGVIGLEELKEWPGEAYGPEAEEVELAVHEIERIGMARLNVARQSGANTVCATNPQGASVVAGGASVLIADPDAPYLEMLTKQLRERGYTVLVADDGAQALEVINQIAPDVIVTEVMLPKLSAFELRERLRHSAELSEIPFIMVSHRKTDELIEKASNLGIVHYLRKPFSLVELIGLLHNLTGSRGE